MQRWTTTNKVRNVRKEYRSERRKIMLQSM
jgi:hypothetical protein